MKLRQKAVILDSTDNVATALADLKAGDTGNPITYKQLPEHLDVFVELADKVGSGKQTKAEIINYGNFPNIFTVGPVI